MTTRYTKDHEWIAAAGGEATVGISNYAQDQLGDVVYVELPAVGDQVEQFKTFGVVESVKTASDLFAPIGGEVAEVNSSLVDEPAQINDSPYGDGWILKIRPADASALAKQLDALMTADEYAQEIDS